MYGLSRETINGIKQVLAKNERLEKAVIYGSRAKGTHRKGSDIDMTLYGKELTLDNCVFPLMDALDELDLPYLFDISLFNHIDDKDVIEHITRVGKVFYQKEK